MSCANDICSKLISVQPATPAWADWRWLGAIVSLYDVFQAMRRVRTRAYQRRDLAELDDRLLADIGLTREQALRESRKWSWE